MSPPDEERPKEPDEESGGEEGRKGRDPPQGEAEPAKQDQHKEENETEGNQSILSGRDPPPVPAGEAGPGVPEKENDGKCAEKEEIDRTQGNYGLQGHKNRLSKAEFSHAGTPEGASTGRFLLWTSKNRGRRVDLTASPHRQRHTRHTVPQRRPGARFRKTHKPAERGPAQSLSAPSSNQSRYARS